MIGRAVDLSYYCGGVRLLCKFVNDIDWILGDCCGGMRVFWNVGLFEVFCLWCCEFVVNLAVSLANECRLRVGLLDADVYGPSIPMMMKLHGKPEVSAGAALINFCILCFHAHSNSLIFFYICWISWLFIFVFSPLDIGLHHLPFRKQQRVKLKLELLCYFFGQKISVVITS